jgi:hypothetical protein
MDRREFLMLGGLVVAGTCLLGTAWSADKPAKLPDHAVSRIPPRQWLTGSPYSGCARPLACADVLAVWERRRHPML